MKESELLKKFFPFGIKTNKNYKLFCFHHAGGSAIIFNKWRNYSPLLEVIPIEIPGRGTRMDEMCITDFNQLTDQTAAAMATVCTDRPFFVYGHSLGTIIAFETICKLKKKYGLEPEKLFVAARHAPMDVDVSDYHCSMGVEALKKELLRLGMVDQEMIDNDVFQRYFLPVVFCDYQLHEDYHYKGDVLDVPIVAMNGTSDDSAQAFQMEQWGQVTRNSFRQYEFNGTHFFPYETEWRYVLETVLKEIRDSFKTAKKVRIH